jgi:hypothetical protein
MKCVASKMEVIEQVGQLISFVPPKHHLVICSDAEDTLGGNWETMRKDAEAEMERSFCSSASGGD